MIVKRSERNQVAIPKKLIKQASLTDEDVFFDIEYVRGVFILKPLTFEERISPEALARFKAAILTSEPGDRRFSSMRQALAALDRKKRR